MPFLDEMRFNSSALANYKATLLVKRNVIDTFETRVYDAPLYGDHRRKISAAGRCSWPKDENSLLSRENDVYESLANCNAAKPNKLIFVYCVSSCQCVRCSNTMGNGTETTVKASSFLMSLILIASEIDGHIVLAIIILVCCFAWSSFIAVRWAFAYLLMHSSHLAIHHPKDMIQFSGIANRFCAIEFIIRAPSGRLRPLIEICRQILKMPRTHRLFRCVAVNFCWRWLFAGRLNCVLHFLPRKIWSKVSTKSTRMFCCRSLVNECFSLKLIVQFGPQMTWALSNFGWLTSMYDVPMK